MEVPEMYTLRDVRKSVLQDNINQGASNVKNSTLTTGTLVSTLYKKIFI
jgi:hypothetical protein